MDFHRKVFNKERVNDYFLTPNEQFFSLYHGENKLH